MFRPLKTSQVVVDIAVAVLFFLVAWPIETALVNWPGMETRFGAFGVALAGAGVAAIFSTALAFRRASPALALGIAWIGALLQVGLARPPSFSDVAIFAVLFGTAAYGSRRVYWAGLASTILGALVITLYLTAGPLYAGGGLSWQTLPLALVMLVAAGFALGLSWTAGALLRTATRARANRQAQALAEAEAAAEQERVRIARDMHDVVAHSLAVVIAQADGARYALAGARGRTGSGAGGGEDAASAALQTISTTAREALADVRLLLTQLRQPRSPLPSSPAPPPGASGGRGPVQPEGPQPTLADLEGLFAQVRAAGVELRVDVDPAPAGEPSAAVQLALFRILQEALTNALRHGNGSPVLVRMAWLPAVHQARPGVEFQVRNRLRPGDRPAETGHGLIGMGERASLVGGWLNASDTDGEFVVSGILPTGAAA